MADDLAFFEDGPNPIASGGADIGVAGFPGPIDDAAHDGDGFVDAMLFKIILYRLGGGDEVDRGPAAGGAGDEGRIILLQSKVMEQPAACLDLLLGIIGKRDADGVAYSFQ